MPRIASTLFLVVLAFFTPATVAGQQICQTMDTVPGFANEHLVDEYHERVFERIQTATNPEQVLIGVYTIGNNMVAAGLAEMVPAGTKIQIITAKPLTGSGTSGTGTMKDPTTFSDRPQVKLQGRVLRTGRVLWFHSNGIDFDQ